MYYALVHFLEHYPPSIDSFRQKYDPRADIIKPHLTFVFPVEASINVNTLTKHVEHIASQTKSFNFTLSGITRSWDDIIFLTVSKGEDQILKLHQNLYSNELEKYLRKDIQFIPHITLGELNKGKKTALKEAESLDINYCVNLDKLTLITREHKMAKELSTQHFLLR